MSSTHAVTDEFQRRLRLLPDGYHEGDFADRRWGVTVRRAADDRRVWLYGEELGGTDVVSFNLYRLSDGLSLKPCEMSSEKVIDFVLRFRPNRV